MNQGRSQDFSEVRITFQIALEPPPPTKGADLVKSL